MKISKKITKDIKKQMSNKKYRGIQDMEIGQAIEDVINIDET